jgi:hypothetical protein
VIDIRCVCGAVYHADERHAGKQLRCTRCMATLAVAPVNFPSEITRESDHGEINPRRKNPVEITVNRREMSPTFFALVGLALVIVLASLAVWKMGRPKQKLLPSVVPNKGEASLQDVIPPCAHAQPVERLSTGQKIEDGERKDGNSTLMVRNGTREDAAVRLVDSVTGRTTRFVYVRAGAEYKVLGIEPGTYRLDFATGSDWVTACRDFIHDTSYSEFERDLVFKFSSTENEEEITTWTTRGEVTLNPIVGGNAKIRRVDRKRFLEGDRYVRLEP